MYRAYIYTRYTLYYPGFLGTDGSSSVNTLDFATEESGDKPMFLYGERKVSKRVGKFRRIQSAMVVKGMFVKRVIN